MCCTVHEADRFDFKRMNGMGEPREGGTRGSARFERDSRKRESYVERNEF